MFSGINVRLSASTMYKLFTGKKLEHKDLVWVPYKKLERGYVIRISDWPYVIWVKDVRGDVDCNNMKVEFAAANIETDFVGGYPDERT